MLQKDYIKWQERVAARRIQQIEGLKYTEALRKVRRNPENYYHLKEKV